MIAILHSLFIVISGTAEMEIGRDGTVRARRQAVRASRQASGLVPRSVATFAGTVFQGEQKSAVVELTPLRYDVRRGRLVLASRVRFRLDFSARDPEEAGLGTRGRRRPRSTSPLGTVLAELHTSREGVHAVAFETLFPTGGVATREQLLELSELILEKTAPDVRVYSDESYEAITFDGDEILVHSTEEPVKGKVNKQLIKEISKLFHTNVELVSGATSRQKKLLVKGVAKKEVERCLFQESS